MAKIGSILQETRLRKGLTLERIADDTNISVRFLAKIEGDDFTGFPGEPYVVGFIHNYADYLGFNPDDVVARYRSAEAPEASNAGGKTSTPGGDDRAIPENAAPEKTPPTSDAPGVASAAVVPEAPASTTKTKRRRKAKASGDGEPVRVPVGGEAPAKPAAEGQTIPKPSADAVSAAAGFPRPLQNPETEPKTASTTPIRQATKGPGPRVVVVGALTIIILAAAIFWIVAGGSISGTGSLPKRKEPAEYRVEGGPFEKRLYVGDSLLVPLGDDVYKIKLSAIAETVTLETPLGPISLGLGEAGPLDPDKDGVPNVSIALGDFEKNKPAAGALLRVEFAPPPENASESADVTIPENQAQAGPSASQPKPDTVILKSSRGPYPFVVQVSFRGNCLFRYEADRKEWVEKYYSKGETATINVSNGLTVWASNAQAAKMTFQAGGGKTADLELGAPGEIAVKRIAWGHAEGASALISSDLD